MRSSFAVLFALFVLTATISTVVNAGELDEYYKGHLVSASKQISVKYANGEVRIFEISDSGKATIYNESKMKMLGIESPAHSNCGKLIGELASEYDAVFKTDENELVTMSFKASTPEAKVRISGDCDGNISGKFALYVDDAQQLPMQVATNPEPAGSPAVDARFVGAVVALSPTLTVRTGDGVIHEFSTANLKGGGIYNDLTMVELGSDQRGTDCSDYMAEMLKPFDVTIKTRKGMTRTATVIPAAEGLAVPERVRVFASCDGNSLTGVQVATNRRELFKVK